MARYSLGLESSQDRASSVVDRRAVLDLQEKHQDMTVEILPSEGHSFLQLQKTFDLKYLSSVIHV